MNKFYLLLLTMMCAGSMQAQCSGGFMFVSASAPGPGSTTTLSSCNFSGDYNTVSGIIAGNSYTVTAVQANGNARCITVHTGSQSGPVVAYGMGSVTFTAPSSGTYYLVYNQNCSGCGTASNCITTTITNNGASSGPCASITNISGCGQAFTVSTTGASAFVSSLCSTSTPGLEQIISFTATTTGNYSLNFSSITGGGYAVGWKAASTGCTATGWNCVGTYTTPGTSATVALTAGQTYYFILDATSITASGATFSFNCPAGGPTTAGDCGVAANVCSNASFSIDPNGSGAINEICPAGTCASNPSANVTSSNPGCLLSGELNSTWMVVNVLTGGSLTFQIGTPYSGSYNCLDWAMWPYSASTCSAISAGTLAPIRCNYNGSCEQFTGLASSMPAGATSMTNWESPVTAGSYSQYVICLSNYSSATTSVPLSFGGTAVVSCSPLGTEALSLAGTAEAGQNNLYWTTSHELNSDKFLIQRSRDGQQFETIGEIDAAGYSLEMQSYSFADMTPWNGECIYRIVMVHINGTFIESNLLSLKQSYNHAAEIIQAYPNPATDELNVLLTCEEAAVKLELRGMNGERTWMNEVDMELGGAFRKIDTEGLAAGIYFLEVSANGKVIATRKVVII